MADLDVEKLRGLLESLGIGKRGLDTPAERDYLSGVMDTANIGYEKTGGVMDYAPADQSAFMQKLKYLSGSNFDLPIGSDARRDAIANLTEDDFRKLAELNYGGANVRMNQDVPEVNWIGNHPLDPITGKVLDSPTAAGGYTFDVDGQTEGYTFDSYPTKESIERMRAIQGITASGLNPAMESTAGGDTEQQFVQKVMADKDRIFKTKMSQLTPQQIQQVNAVMQRLSPEQQQLFIEQVVTGNVPLDGYAIQDEGLPIQNLGFGY